MACENCGCDITNEDIKKLDTKRFNELLNAVKNEKFCPETNTKIDRMIKDNIK